MDKRVISAIIAIPLLLFFTIKGGIIFKIGVFILSLIGIYEYSNAYKNTNNKVIVPILLFGLLLHTVILNMRNLEVLFPLIILICVVSMATPIFTKKYNIISSAITVIGFIYIVNFFGFLVLLRTEVQGYKYIWIVFLIAWASDTFAYYSGRIFGRHKLCPEVSPKKTVEGAVGGILGSIIGLIIWHFLFKDITIPVAHLIALGFFGGIISQIGDLSASLIKRFVNIKDYGNIMPGHGGVLDRFDSILFIAPIVYYYIELFIV
ncbi:Phosphatidate cytidylyltransferase [Caloramator mitchellensis]|uniref:Phosphatidate cytidylyltransferase n=1 Tax=Caloramator mitchellensis TaxID=908809 RepID=A0A0R3K1Y0_CALMK|nr:phosphatidate cytidylyltransferase [Caloramator mitchellensis]KRQ86981.1 Phosphatidate cytidylyltransferase [Caloramator mitchellensis]